MKQLMFLGLSAWVIASCSPAEKGPEDGATTFSAAQVDVSSASSLSTTAQADTLTCDYPVGPKDTKASVMERFGKSAQVADAYGPEGMVLKAVVLYGQDPKRRVEVILNDEDPNKIEGVRLKSEATSWTVEGLRLGDSIRAVTAKNGKPFELGGFGWDYGGYAQDFKKGTLDPLDKNCRLSLRFDVAGENISSDTQGERTLISDDPKVIAAQAHITEIMISHLP